MTTADQKPNQPDLFDPFGFGTSLPTYPVDVDTERQAALELGTLHGDAFGAFDELAEANGGGLYGLAVGLVGKLLDRTYITDDDASRLAALLELIRTTDPEVLLKVEKIYGEAVADSSASPGALAIISMALDSLRRSTVELSEEGVILADAVGGLYGLHVGGVPGLFAAEMAASYVAMHVRVSWH
ncbi:MAG: hypothetical protein ACRDQB_04845 [Thermocrispum sp.]